jgi:hypothetical protein
MKFSCPEQECEYGGIGAYELNIPQEACVDEKNIATPFCPHCGNTLVMSEAIAEYFEQ